MSQLPNCPCCGEDALDLRSYALENGHMHYRVECSYCGVEFHHEDFYGYNNVMKYFEEVSAGNTCRNLSERGANGWLCSECGSKREKQADEDEYSVCPDCGAEVEEW